MRIPLLAFSAMLLLTSCRYFGGERVHGNGKVVTQTRNTGSFNSIEAGGALEVRVRQDANTSLKIETDENLQEYIEAYTDGHTLILKQKQGFNPDPTNAIIVYVSAPSFESLELSGASKMIGETALSGDKLEMHISGASELAMELRVSKLKAELSGASSLRLKGNAASVSTEASGASKIRCMDLATDETTLDLSGASNAEVTANKQLNIEVSGASDVRYRGNASVSQKSSGASNVEKVS